MKIYLLIVLAIFGFICIQIGKEQQLADMRHAYAVCTVAHFQIDGQSEKACANAQDATHTEFICSHDFKHCWSEVK